jgi:hypothetical protein
MTIMIKMMMGPGDADELTTTAQSNYYCDNWASTISPKGFIF